MSKLQVGDRVIRIAGCNGCIFEVRDTGEVTDVFGISCSVLSDKNKKVSTGNLVENLEVISRRNNKSFMSSLKEIVSGLFTTEPQKSRQKAGITDEKGKLTPEGENVYLNYLLSKEPTTAGFDDLIVKPVVAEMEKNTK